MQRGIALIVAVEEIALKVLDGPYQRAFIDSVGRFRKFFRVSTQALRAAAYLGIAGCAAP